MYILEKCSNLLNLPYIYLNVGLKSIDFRSYSKMLEKSVRPEVRGTTDFNDGAYSLSKTSPSSPSYPSRTPHDTHHFSLRTDRQRLIVNTDRRGHRCALFYMPFVVKRVLYVMGLVRPAHSAPSVTYHLLGW